MLITDKDMPLVLLNIERADEVALDTETTGFNVRNRVDYLMGISFSTGAEHGYIPFRHNSQNVELRWINPLFERLENKPLIWHNRKFDFHSIRTLGVDPLRLRGLQFDTLLIAHLIKEELYSKELDALAKIYLNKRKEQTDEIHKIGQLYGWDSITPSVMAPYATTDADLTFELKRKLWPELVKQELEDVYWNTEAPYSTLLYKMEQRGVGVNTELANELNEFGKARLATIKRNLHFNPASTKDLGEYLLDELNLPILGTTPKGAPSFRKEVMEEYDQILQTSNNPAAKLIAEYRGWQKATSSLYQPLLTKVGPDGKVRTSFKQHGTVTGRSSAEDPNLQQVPRGSRKPWNGRAKECFTSGDPNRTIIGWDHSQLELRLGAAYGREAVLLTEFEKPKADPFEVLCRIIFNDFTPELRHDTKTFVYANLYGAGLAKIAAQLNRTLAETKPLYDNYKAGIPGITEVAQRVNRIMMQRGYIRYWDGRRRHIRNKEDRHKAWNSMIQGGGAQLVKQGMIRCSEFEDDDCYMVLTVHDEITFNITTAAIEDYRPKIEKAMTDFPDFGVRFAVESKEWGK